MQHLKCSSIFMISLCDNKKSLTVISGSFSRLSAKLVTLQTEFHCSYILTLFINFRVVARMLLRKYPFWAKSDAAVIF